MSDECQKIPKNTFDALKLKISEQCVILGIPFNTYTKWSRQKRKDYFDDYFESINQKLVLKQAVKQASTELVNKAITDDELVDKIKIFVLDTLANSGTNLDEIIASLVDCQEVNKDGKNHGLADAGNLTVAKMRLAIEIGKIFNDKTGA